MPKTGRQRTRREGRRGGRRARADSPCDDRNRRSMSKRRGKKEGAEEVKRRKVTG